ncbi:hypothetical protein CBR_g53500 [Chara braunii]|uniref:DUF659 domain-containing protein n=1 Tax=Chara braunii TaxID=69332 RepID=A0A388MAV1_CHABU|nr:hypothetical protein CBR_g53500 [Chara braunii]|eukprot:GBG91686.1 hypothetical protein CBR_g53500 [Chara braunii]
MKKIQAYLVERGFADKGRQLGQQQGDSGEEDEDNPERVAQEDDEQGGGACEAPESGGARDVSRGGDDKSAEVPIDVEREAERDCGELRAEKRAVTGVGTSRKRKTSSQPLPATATTKKLRQSRMEESFDPKWQRDRDAYFLQWFYACGIPFHAARRPEYNTFRRHLATCPPRVHPSLPNYRRISGDGIVKQDKDVAEMLATLRRDVVVTGTTILTDGRKSITAYQIVNFLAVGSSGAYLLRTVQRDGAEQDTASVVLRRWKKVLDDFGIENVNAICTDSTGTYVAAAKFLAQDKDLQYSCITWPPCAVHVRNLMLSDIDKDGRDGGVGHTEDTIIKARAVVRFIRSHGAALTLFRRFSARHPTKGQTAPSSALSGTSGRGRELILPSADQIHHAVPNVRAVVGAMSHA